MSNPTYISQGLTWGTISSDNKDFPLPWKNLVFLSPEIRKEGFAVGNIVEKFESKEPIGSAKIGAIVYASKPSKGEFNAIAEVTKREDAAVKEDQQFPFTISTEYSPLKNPIGFLLIDESGEFILPVLGATGEASFWVELTEDINSEISCFITLVWQAQCEFAKCVQAYLTQMQFGIFNCEALENLKNKRRALEILNCYDVRDIPNDTTEYNFFTYNQMKKLLNS